MLTRRSVLRSTLLVGAAAAVPAAITSCARPEAGAEAGTPGSAIASAQVARGPGDPDSAALAAASVRGLGADLFSVLAAESGNVVFSPYSVAVALAMVRQGAQGTTAAEMDAVLGITELPTFTAGLNALTQAVEATAGRRARTDGSSATVSLSVANSMWAQQGVAWTPDFLDVLAREFDSAVRLVDYVAAPEPARLAINAWVSDRTRGRIPELLARGIIDQLTRLVLVNAIYLKAPWETPFGPALEPETPFTLSDGSRVRVPRMTAELVGAAVTAGDGWRAVHLPYAGRELAMTVVVPDADTTELTSGLDGAELARMLQADPGGGMVQLTMPRWTYRTTASLNSALATLGMPSAFGPATADLEGMTDQADLHLSEVAHEAFIAVDEEGTEAAAATAAVAGIQSAVVPDEVIDVDRPFLFAVHHPSSATPLFLGRVSDPRET